MTERRFTQLAGRIDTALDTIFRRLQRNIQPLEDELTSAVMTEVRTLALVGERVRPSVENLRIAQAAIERLRTRVLPGILESRVSALEQALTAVTAPSDEMYKALVEGAVLGTGAVAPSVGRITEELMRSAKADALQGLLGSGLNQEMLIPVKRAIEQNIVVGGSLAQLSQIVRQAAGQYARYATTATTDVVNQYNANYTRALAADLPIEFYYYTPGVMDSSRPFCVKRQGKFFHRKEVEAWAREEWAGKAEGTDARSIFVLRGGYNCRHQILPAPLSAVPKSVIDRAKREGLYRPEAKQRAVA